MYEEATLCSLRTLMSRSVRQLKTYSSSIEIGIGIGIGIGVGPGSGKSRVDPSEVAFRFGWDE